MNLVVSLFGLVGSVWTIWITALMLYVLVSVAFQSGIIGALGLHGLYREGKSL